MYRLVCFDLDDTLFDYTAAKEKYCKALLNDNNIKTNFPINWESVANEERKELCRFLIRSFPQLDCSFATLLKNFETRLPEYISVNPVLHDLLAAITRDSLLAITSNGSRRFQRRKLAGLNIDQWISGVFISGEIGHKKPDQLFFELVLNRFNCKPVEAIIIGDDPLADMTGGINAGFATCWISHGRRYSRELPQPDYIVEDISELSTVLNIRPGST